MTLASSFALLWAMTIIVLIPGPAVLLVISRSLKSGFQSGIRVVLGALIGDYLYIAAVMLGLVTLAENMGGAFTGLKYLGGAYLIWMGIQAWREPVTAIDIAAEATLMPPSIPHSSSWVNDMTAGFVCIIANPKVLLFYVSFFPAFLNLNSITPRDVVSVFVVITIAVSGVLSFYAYIASRAGEHFKSARANHIVNRVSAAIFIASGAWLLLQG